MPFVTRCGTVFLALLTLLYASKGLELLTLRPEPPSDFYQRWVEEQYVLAGRDPYDAYFASNFSSIHPAPWAPRLTAPLPELGAPKMASYPPWAFFSGAVVYGLPSLTSERCYFAVLNVAALALLFCLGYRTGRPFGWWEGVALGFAGTAISAISTTMGVGQYGLLILAPLVLSLTALRRGRETAAGFWHGVAAAKPTLSGPFGLIFLFPLRWRALWALALYFAVANAAVWLRTGVNPLEMVSQMLKSGETFLASSYGPLNVLIWFGMPAAWAGLIVAASGVAVTSLMLLLFPQAPLLTRFAIAAVMARLWSYHLLYDNLILAFLLLAVGELALRHPSPLHRAAFLLVGTTLWLPGKCSDNLFFQIYQMTIWCMAAARLLFFVPFRFRPGKSPAPA